MIEQALANNRDLRVATLNIDKVRALYQIQSAELYPTITASASADVYRIPENLSGKGHPQTVSVYTVGLGTVSWELDFFGRIRSLKSRALEQYLATEQARSATQIIAGGCRSLQLSESGFRQGKPQTGKSNAGYATVFLRTNLEYQRFWDDL